MRSAGVAASFSFGLFDSFRGRTTPFSLLAHRLGLLAVAHQTCNLHAPLSLLAQTFGTHGGQFQHFQNLIAAEARTRW
jgi:hypothetical protein